MLEELLDAMRSTGIPFAQDAWDTAPETGPYGVVSLAGVTPLYADDGIAEVMERYAVDLFTRDAGAAEADLVMDALAELGVAWSLASRVYDMPQGLTHYLLTVQEAV